MGANVMMGLCRVVGGCVEFVGPTIHRQAVVVQLFIAKRCRVARFCVEVEMPYVGRLFCLWGHSIGYIYSRNVPTNYGDAGDRRPSKA